VKLKQVYTRYIYLIVNTLNDMIIKVQYEYLCNVYTIYLMTLIVCYKIILISEKVSLCEFALFTIMILLYLYVASCYSITV